uniref:Cysteine rich secreted protein n=1 Tax=Riptortus pedestris TaxID=329032 RepID=R4WQA0_RIPPE|nr:cysteine rich secreted protein [Riptortus pedestris]
MSLKNFFFVFAIVMVAAIFAARADDPAPEKHCPPGAAQWPDTGDCRTFYVCGEKGETVDKCLWLLRRFNRETLKCDWAWHVDCSVKPKEPVVPPKP